jgi:hypothetical protein
MKMILSSLNLVRKIGVCITSEENLFNNLFALIESPDPKDSKKRGVK